MSEDDDYDTVESQLPSFGRGEECLRVVSFGGGASGDVAENG